MTKSRIPLLHPAARGFAIALPLALAILTTACSDSTEPVNTECSVAATLTLGETVNGALQQSDCKLADNSNVDYYTLVITEAVQIQIDLTSAAFDAYLWIREGDDGEPLADDDSGGGNNARLTINLDPGTYTILANSYEASETGAYTLLAAVVTP